MKKIETFFQNVNDNHLVCKSHMNKGTLQETELQFVLLEYTVPLGKRVMQNFTCTVMSYKAPISHIDINSPKSGISLV